MDPEVQSYLNSLDALRGEVRSAIQGLSAEALNWRPLPEGTNSIYVLVSHMTGSESFLIHQVIGGRDIGRNRDAEFVARGESPAELEALIDRAGQGTREVLQGLTSADLGVIKELGGGRPSQTARWCVVHIIEHLALHLGHLQLTKQLWEEGPGSR